MSKVKLILILGIIAVLAGFFIRKGIADKKVNQITSFEECRDAGYPVAESYPEQCSTPEGETFVRVIEAEEIVVEGEIVCLPHKVTEGPQTLECAFGIKDKSGNYYALSDPQMIYVPKLPTGKKATVSGVLRDAKDSKYDIMGTILITGVIQEDNSSENNFSESGNLVNTDPLSSAQGPDFSLLYEKPGAPAIKVNLVFNENSRCVMGTTAKPCSEAELKVGDRVLVEGVRNADEIVVWMLSEVAR